MKLMIAADREVMSPKNNQLVLIVEDEAILRNSMARGLGRLPGVEIAHAGNLKDAREIIDVLAPRVVITDLDLPDGSGTELIAELERRRTDSSIIVVSAYVDTHQRELAMRPEIEIREKPLPLEQLRQLVRDKLGLSPSHEEPRQPFSAVDYVQLACMGQRSVEITVMGSDKMHGRVQICRGELWAATDQDGSGAEALRRILFHTGGRIDVRALEPAEAAPRNLEDNWQWLLMEAARIADEVSRDEIQVPPVDLGAPLFGDGEEEESWDDFADCDAAMQHLTETVLGAESRPDEKPPAPTRSAESTPDERRFKQLFDEGVEALLSKRYHDAYRLFCHADSICPGDRTVEGNLQRLRQMGYALDEEVTR